MCICCGDEACQYGEICAWKNNFVKYYNQSGKASADGRPAEWEHVIPKAVIEKSDCFDGDMYGNGIVYALDKEAHRNAVHGAGGGITSTGNSITSRNWADVISGLFNQCKSDAAVDLLIRDEVHSINIFRCEIYEKGQNINAMRYIASLGAALYEYCNMGIIQKKTLNDAYEWICAELTKSPEEISYCGK